MLKMYVVKDKLVEFGTSIFLAVSDEVAIREVKNVVNTAGTPFNLNSEDYSLYSVGEFDTKLGIIKPNLELIAHLDSLKVKEVPVNYGDN